MGDQISRAETAEYLKSVLLEAARLSVGEEAELFAKLANKAVDEWLNAVPAVDAAPVVHGRWKTVKAGASNNYPFWDSKCSGCGYTTAITTTGWQYCPACGARMSEG